MRPDVVLIRPWAHNCVPAGAIVQDALGVGYLAAVLRQQGIQVVVLDALVFHFGDAEIVACLTELRPKVVGISLHSFADYRHSVAISEGIARLDPSTYCVWGGEHATYLADRIMELHPSVDAVILGEGERTFPELVAHFLSGDTARPIAGAVVRGADGAILRGEARPAIANLDELPFPDKDIVELALRWNRPVSISILTGRGCTNSCRFCTAHDFLRFGGGPVWRRRSPVSVAAEIEWLVHGYLHRHNVQPVLQFQDVIFLGTSPAARQWAVELLDELDARSLRVPFYCMARADAIIANQDILPRLTQVGLCSVEVGIEGGVDRILQRYNKNNSPADNEAAIKLLQKHGIAFDASGYIMFDPTMTLDELRKNAHYLAEVGTGTWDFFVTRLQLYPGSKLRDEMIQQGGFSPNADLDATCEYAFEDPLVDEVARKALMYDSSIRRLDACIRAAKAHLVLNRQPHRTDRNGLEQAVKRAQSLYLQYMLALIGFAEEGKMAERFAPELRKFLDQVAMMLRSLEELLEETTHPMYQP